MPPEALNANVMTTLMATQAARRSIASTSREPTRRTVLRLAAFHRPRNRRRPDVREWFPPRFPPHLRKGGEFRGPWPCLFRFVSHDSEPDGLLIGLRTRGFAQHHPDDFAVRNDDDLVVLGSEPHGRHRRCDPVCLERHAVGESHLELD